MAIELEIMGHDQTNPDLMALVMRRSKDHGFSPFQVKTQSMGYIYNRCANCVQTAMHRR